MSSISSEWDPTTRHISRWSRFWYRYGRPALVYAVLMVMATLFLLPFYILFRNAFLERSHMTGNVAWQWLPIPPSIVGWQGILRRAVTGSNPTPQLYFAVFNSFIIAVFEVIGGLTVNGLAGYGVARLPGRLEHDLLEELLVDEVRAGAGHDQALRPDDPDGQEINVLITAAGLDDVRFPLSESRRVEDDEIVAQLGIS